MDRESTAATAGTMIPRAGMLATVRNRRGVVAAVEPFDGETGRLHLVHLEYTDDHAPAEERLLWELEPSRHLLEPNALPDPAHAGGPMPADDFDALLRAARWTALTPYLDPGDNDGRTRREPIASPFHGGVRIESYQLVPLLKALRMPRVNLLIADDVGLGKTVEAGLILTELLLRRRIQQVLVLTPASLRQQWREELWEKFSLRFEVVDRQGTERLRRGLGMDATPWRSFSRIVASYHYLRQPDVLEQFLAACRTPEGSPHLPWDLLIVDECHNLMPSPFGEDSELCRMLRLVAPQFEHRLFLSATPHNGHTRSFTGLLEMLDPVRFSRTSEMGSAMRGRIEDVVVRRLKRDINARSTTPRFCTRLPPKALLLDTDPREARLSTAFDAFRTAIRALVSRGPAPGRRTGAFAVEILGKRLLSCPMAFADSWSRARQGFSGAETATEKDVATAERTLRQETGDDREAQQREATAATVAGAWLRNFADALDAQIHDLERALETLGFDLDDAPITEQTPVADARFDALLTLVDRLLIQSSGRARGGAGDEPAFRPDERLIVFTEYKTTLDYLARRLRERYPDDRVLTLFGSGGRGGMDQSDREHVKAAFNDPASPVRVLVATDAASEGLNLHRTARYLLHYDCPWNPSRLEQRNGRIDRYGQARDVMVHHFASTADPDLDFLDHVIRKADEIREDLGSLNEVFDRAVHRRLVRSEDAAAVRADLDRDTASSRGSADFAADATVTAADPEAREAAVIEAMAGEIDLDPAALRDALEAALAVPAGRPQLRADAESGFSRVLHPDLAGWRDVIDEAVRRPSSAGGYGPMPRLAFSTEPFIERLGPLSVFRPRQDALLVHLAHPLMQRALGVLTRSRYPGANETSRWTVRSGPVPAGADAVILLSIEELGVNELRETFHRWVRTLALPVRDGLAGDPLPHVPAPLDAWTERQLRQRAAAMLDGDAEASSFVAFVLEQVCGLDASTGAWTRGSRVASDWGRRAVTGETVKPRHLWQGRHGGRLPVFIDDGGRLGIGRSRRAVSRVLGWLRAGGEHLALVTNGRQWRLLFAGLDYDAWCEWDLDLWFEEGELSPQVTALRTLLRAELWTPETESAEPPLLQAVRDTRKGQAELSEVLGERVREAVEILIRAHGDVLSSLVELEGVQDYVEDLAGDAGDSTPDLDEIQEMFGAGHADIYRAACRVAMRLVVILFAESRDLLPRDNPLYHQSYGLHGLLERLERAAARGAASRAASAHGPASWPCSHSFGRAPIIRICR